MTSIDRIAHPRFKRALLRLALNVVIIGVVIVATWSAFPTRDPGLRGITSRDMDICDANISLVVREVDLRSREVVLSGRISLTYAVTKVEEGAVGVLSVQAHRDLNSRSAPVDVEFPLISDSNVVGGEMDLPTFKVPLMTGSMNNYPHDRYTTYFQVSLKARGVTLAPHKDRRPESGLFYAISSVRLDDNLGDWSLPPLNTKGGFTNAGANHDGAYQSKLQVDLARTQKTLTFIYSVLLTPLLLVFALVVWRWRSDKTSPLELAAALLAVVTLRQVLVPADIAGFTTLDKLLGIEVAIVAAATIFAYTRPAR